MVAQSDLDFDKRHDFGHGVVLKTIHWHGNTKKLPENKHIREIVIEDAEVPAQFKGKQVAIYVNFNHRDETTNGNWKTNWHLEGVSVMFK